MLIDDAGTPLILSKPSGDGEREVYEHALRLSRRLREGDDFAIDRGERALRLTERGRARLEALAKPGGADWGHPRRREELVARALRALHLFLRDRDYLVRDEKVQIVDRNTGRVMADRSWEGGLHQLVELKEGVPVTEARETLARITYQQLFQRYHWLAGMTGTAREAAGELREVYGLGFVRVPTHRAVRRRALPARVLPDLAAKQAAVCERVRSLRDAGRPVLVGTWSVASSEALSAALARAGLEHEVLNARQDAREAEIVARAGEAGRITVATNMAGRGTDIALGPGVAEAGGLHVIATERAESSRVDRQLQGRCARQGDPGSHEAILSLDDELVVVFYPRGFTGLLSKANLADGVLGWGVGKALFAFPQALRERRNARSRRELLRRNEQLDRSLGFTGALE